MKERREREKNQAGRKRLFLYKRYLRPCLQKTQEIKNISKGVKLKLIC